jgi:methionyl-tRNA formyltransferase
MRTGILANSLPTAVRIYNELEAKGRGELFIILCPTPGTSLVNSLLKHLARLVLRPRRFKSLQLLLNGRVIVITKPLAHHATEARIKRLKLDIGLHKGAEIYREPLIAAFRIGILNPHIGILPAYRGRNVMEWSILNGADVGITVFFLDAGIDTGERILISEKVDISHCNTIDEAKQYLFDLDVVFFARALAVVDSGTVNYQRNDGSGRRYYVMSSLMKGVVEKLIESK